MSEHLIALPPDYRLQDVLAFHGRDTEGVAEQVGATTIRKGICVDGAAVALELMFEPDRVRCRIDADGAAPPAHRLDAILRGVLGLAIDPAPFIAFTAADALLGPLTRQRPGLRIIQSASVFEAVTWAIIGQQINLAFAIALRRTFIQQAGRRHSSGLWCYPEAADAARLQADDLTGRKFSRAKADTVLRLARLVHDGELDLAPGAPVGELSAALLAVKGIGPWTVNYALLRGYGYPDCSLHGDVAVRTAIGRLQGAAEKPDIAAAERFLAQYAPHRTLAAAHLWASL